MEIFSKYTVFFVEHMMQVELGLLAPDEPPWAKGAVTFVSFCLFGAVPLASYAAVAATPCVGVLFGTCALFAAIFLLGAVKGRAEQCRRLWSAHDRERRSGGRRVVSYRPGV